MLSSYLNSCKKILFAFSIFFVSCGVPNYFYLGSSFVYVKTSPEPPSSVRVVFEINDDIQLRKCQNCPSVCLFYFIDNNSFSNNSSRIISDFNTKYGAVTNKGSLLDIKKGEITNVIDKFTPNDDQSVKISIYPFAFKNGKEVARPFYHIPIPVDDEGRPAVSSIEFLLIFNPAEKRLSVKYPEHAGDEEALWREEELVRGNEKTFSEIISISDFTTYKNQNPDLDAVSDRSLVKLYVMAAMCASSGSYDNIYWSSLNILDNSAVFDLNDV